MPDRKNRAYAVKAATITDIMAIKKPQSVGFEAVFYKNTRYLRRTPMWVSTVLIRFDSEVAKSGYSFAIFSGLVARLS